MQIAGKPMRVKLITSLTKYDKRCISGELGWTIPNCKIGIWGSQDRFVAVKFDNGAVLDILDKSLDYIEESEFNVKSKSKDNKESDSNKREGCIYIRVSTQNQKDRGYSLDAQLENGIKYAKMNNINIYDESKKVRVYEDVHPANDSNRDNFQRMLKDAKDGKFKFIISEMDRFMKNVKEALLIIDDLKRNNILVHFTDFPKSDLNMHSGNKKEGAIYIRVSDLEVDNYFRVKEQIYLCESLARRENINLKDDKTGELRIYQDNIRPDRNTRPGLQKIIADAKSGMFRSICASSDDRISCRIEYTLSLIDDLYKDGIFFYFHDIPFDLYGIDGRIFLEHKQALQMNYFLVPRKLYYYIEDDCTSSNINIKESVNVKESSIKEVTTKNVLIYARTNTITKHIDKQIDKIKQEIDKTDRNFEKRKIIEIIKDENVSGVLPFDKNKGLLRLCDLAKKKKFDELWITSRDRLSRNLIISNTIFEELVKKGIKVISLDNISVKQENNTDINNSQLDDISKTTAIIMNSKEMTEKCSEYGKEYYGNKKKCISCLF